MSKQLNRITSAILASMLAVTILTGCGTNEAKTTESAGTATTKAQQTETQKKALDKVKLNIVLPGDPQPAQDEISKALEEAANKDGLNIEFSYNSIPWGDYSSKTRIMALAGDSIDIMWTHPELLAQLYTANALAPLDDAINSAGQDLKANIPAEYWPNVTIKGKIFGIPAVVPGTATGYSVYIIRGDLREKYGLPEIKTEADMSAFWEAVKKNNPEMIPLSLGVGPGNISGQLMGRKEVYTRGLPPGVVIDMNTNKAAKVFDYPELTAALKASRDRYTAGYVSKDVLSVKDFRAPFTSGKAASTIGDLYEYNNNARAMASLAGAKVEFVRILTAPGAFQEVTTWNFQSVASGSKNVERAVMFMNWVQKDQKNYDLLTLGIDGIDYVLEGDKVGLPAGVDASKPRYAPFEWIWQNPKYMRDRTTNVPGFMDGIKHYDDDVKIRFKGMGFLFDSSTMKTEVAALGSLSDTVNAALSAGTVDYEKVIAQLKADMEKAGLDKAVAEVQKQYDAFMATQK